MIDHNCNRNVARIVPLTFRKSSVWRVAIVASSIIASAFIGTFFLGLQNDIAASKNFRSSSLATRNDIIASKHYEQPASSNIKFWKDSEKISPTSRRLNLMNYMDPKTTSSRMESLSFQTSDAYATDNTDFNTNENNEITSPLPPYNLRNILQTLPAYYRELFILLYNSSTDDFSILINESVDHWVLPVRDRISQLAPILTYSLRNHFPERFPSGGSGAGDGGNDFMLLFSTGLEPKILCECLLPGTRGEWEVCKNEDFAPILQFGAMYRDPGLLPNMVAMPTWQYAWCFTRWIEKGEVCEAFLPKKSESSKYGLVYGEQPSSDEEALSRWNSLKPQLIWRGSDFGFLNCLYPDIRIPEFEKTILPELKGFPRMGPNAHPNKKAHLLLKKWDTLTPRWKGIALTDVAEWETTQRGIRPTTASQLNAMATASSNAPKMIPWIDVKFTSRTKSTFARYESNGIHVQGETLTLEEVAEYRYQIDFGGGGGTTWAGTIQKLAMDGVLFHHITPTQDWFHPDLKPFEHYIPVSTDLSDLQSKFKWALDNPMEAMKISRAATEYSRYMGTPEYWQRAYEKYFVRNLGRVVDAYVSMNDLPADVKAEAGEVLGTMREVARCTGRGKIGHCNIDRL